MSRAEEPRPDDGLSLVEVVVAMLLFGLLAMAVLPIVYNSLALASLNRDDAQASARASAMVSQLRQDFPDANPRTCADLTTFVAGKAPSASSTGPVGAYTVSSCVAANRLAVVRVNAYADYAAYLAGDAAATLSTAVVVKP